MDTDGNTALGEDYYRLYYRDYAAQNPQRKLEYYRDLAIRFAPRRSNLRALDVGCAFGDFLATLPQTWSRAGIDSNGFAISTAAKRYPGISFVQAAGLQLPDRQPFDVITAFDVLEHIEDLDAALAIIEAALSSDGILIFVVPVYDGPLGALVRLLDRDPTHVHKNSRTFWFRAIESRFTVMYREGLFRLLVPGTRRYLHAHSVPLAFLSPAILIVARPRS